jgi:L-threonylcarbamoyladenylate synthase
MRIVKINPNNPDKDIAKLASEILKSAGLVIYPTDTAYGLGGNALDEEAIRKVYEIKGRDLSKPTHVIVRNWQMIDNLCYTNKLAEKLYSKLMPGPLTLILPKKAKVPDILTAGLLTLGIRIPNTPVTQSLSNLVSFPFTTPSANKSGGKVPYSVNEIKRELDIEKVDLILDAGKLPEVAPSTVIDLTKTPPKILREGPITKEDLCAFL